MKRYIFIILVLLSSFWNPLSLSGNTDLELLRKRFLEASAVDYSPNKSVTEHFINYSGFGAANDVLQLQLYMSVHLPDREIKRLYDLIDHDGSFSDIDYDDRTRGKWQPTLHLTRLYALAKLYVSPTSKLYKSLDLSKKLHEGISFWLSKRPTSDNWWHQEIGVPKKLTSILLMLYNELSDEEIRGGLKILEKSKFGRTGQNKVWLATNNLMKGLLTDDKNLVRRAKEEISEEICIGKNEGIQQDWAFHQHGPQIQFGNYGQTYAESISFLLRVFSGTEYAFSSKEYEIVANLIKEGIAWSVYKGLMDQNFCGRQVFKDSGRSKAYSVAVAAQNMAAVGMSDSLYFDRISKEFLEPEKYENTIIGSKYYNSSDCGIYRTRDWYSSIRMHSERTIGFEFTNRENLNGWFSADGALLLMQHGHEYENISAIWDWRCIPGTTSYDDKMPLKTSDKREEKENKSSHVGGLVYNDVMCSTMELDRDGLHAFKSIFFFNDLIVALGSDIYGKNPQIIKTMTTLEQNHLNGRVHKGNNWVWHDDRGYILFGMDTTCVNSMIINTEEQSGCWDRIDPSYKNECETGRIFKCYIEHDTSKKSSYAYAIIPNVRMKKFKHKIKDIELEILVNTKDQQSIKYKDVTIEIDHMMNPGIRIYEKDKLMAEVNLPSVN